MFTKSLGHGVIPAFFTSLLYQPLRMGAKVADDPNPGHDVDGALLPLGVSPFQMGPQLRRDRHRAMATAGMMLDLRLVDNEPGILPVRARSFEVDEFRAAGVSSTTDQDNSPGLAALLDRGESNALKIVLVEIATRLARDLMVGEVALHQLPDTGCRVIAADSGTDLTADSDAPTRRRIRQVVNAVAEFNRRVTVTKLRAASEQKRARGQLCAGRKPFVSLPDEAETLSTFRELRRKPSYEQRRSLQQIYDALNAEGLPTRSGKPWTKHVMNKLLGRRLSARTSFRRWNCVPDRVSYRRVAVSAHLTLVGRCRTLRLPS